MNFFKFKKTTDTDIANEVEEPKCEAGKTYNEQAEKINALSGKCFRVEGTDYCFKVTKTEEGKLSAVIQDNYGVFEVKCFQNYFFEDEGRKFHSVFDRYIQISQEDFESDCTNTDKRFYDLKPGDVLFGRSDSNLSNVGTQVAVVKGTYAIKVGGEIEKRVVVDFADLNYIKKIERNINMSFKYFDYHYTKDSCQIIYSNPSIEHLIGVLQEN